MIVGFIVVDASVNENVEHSQFNLKKREVMYFDDETNEDNIYEQILKIMEKKYQAQSHTRSIEN
jgi:hypothetical protein